VTWARALVAPLAVYALSRVVAWAMVVAAAPGRVTALASLPGYHSFSAESVPPDYAGVMTSWDGQWYWDIAVDGYPSSARDELGQPTQTSLAFYPLYPALARAVMRASGAGFDVVGPALSLVLGAFAVVLLHRLVEECLDRRRALAVTVLVCAFPAAPVLQAAYTESLALALLCLTLLLLRRRHYLAAVVPVLLLGTTRNIAVVLLPVVALHWVSLVRAQRRAPRSPAAAGWLQHWRIAVLASSTIVATGLWPLGTARLTGETDAYLTTLGAWPGFSDTPLASPLVQAVTSQPVLLLLALAGLAAVLIGVRLLPGRRSWGPELTGWGVAYPLYILAASSASFSVVRYLLLAFPLALLWTPDTDDPRQRRRQAAVVGVLVVCGIGLQWLWVSKLLVFAGPDGGWGYP
jgi:hypothetical protein